MYNLTFLGSKPGLERIIKLLKLLGNPEEKLKYIHIAGTNGKGSTSLIIAEILSQAGYKVGRFTSPHLHSYTERFTIDGLNITAAELKEYIDEIDKTVASGFGDNEDKPTEFEFITAIAFKWFQDNDVDIVLLEVGMGGIYDSTNVIRPEVSVITSIDLDHTDFLGNTLEEVAYNKAGIIKADVPVVIGSLPTAALGVIEKFAQENNAPIFGAGLINILKINNMSLNGYDLDIKIGEQIVENLHFALCGDYQLENLITALTAIQVLVYQGYEVALASIRKGLSSLKIPGRLEVVSHNPLIILDVAHNPHGASAVEKALQNLLPKQSKILICGIVDDKDAYSVLQHMGKNTLACIITRPEGRRGENWSRLLPIWQELYPNKPVYLEEDIKEAINQALQEIRDEEYLLICGSFYIVNRARQVLSLV